MNLAIRSGFHFEPDKARTLNENFGFKFYRCDCDDDYCTNFIANDSDYCHENEPVQVIKITDHPFRKDWLPSEVELFLEDMGLPCEPYQIFIEDLKGKCVLFLSLGWNPQG